MSVFGYFYGGDEVGVGVAPAVSVGNGHGGIGVCLRPELKLLYLIKV